MNIRDIYRLSLQERREQYGTTNVQKVTIDGITFRGYKTFTFYWEKTYSEQPERSLSGVINNLNAVPFFVTPRLRINFSMMSIDDYRSLYNLILSRNEFTVTCYNVLTNKNITCKMYFEPDDFPTLYMVARQIQGDNGVERWQEITGIRDYTITMNGTNASLDLVSIIYHSNPPSDTGIADSAEGDNDITLNTDIILGNSTSIPNLTFEDKYIFNGWNTKADGSGIPFVNGKVYQINDSNLTNSTSLILYAQWMSMTTYTLNFSYGLSAPALKNGQEWLSEPVEYGNDVTLPTINENPQVTYEGKIYGGSESPYYNGGWYTTPIKVEPYEDENGNLVGGSVKLTSPYTYNKNASSTIYCLYDTHTYTLTYNTNDSNISLGSVEVPYGETISKPQLSSPNKSFLGWFWMVKNEDGKEVEQAFKKTTMPPYDVTIYAKWEDKK